jgi:hypothetical protein
LDDRAQRLWSIDNGASNDTANAQMDAEEPAHKKRKTIDGEVVGSKGRVIALPAQT